MTESISRGGEKNPCQAMPENDPPSLKLRRGMSGVALASYADRQLRALGFLKFDQQTPELFVDISPPTDMVNLDKVSFFMDIINNSILFQSKRFKSRQLLLQIFARMRILPKFSQCMFDPFFIFRMKF
jgi:hypothetical protein